MNLESRSSTNANTVAVAKITEERGWRVEKKSLRRFLADQKIASSSKKCVLGASYSTSNKLLLVARHIMTTGLQKIAFKVGSVKFANSLSPPSIVKKVRTGSKSSQGT